MINIKNRKKNKTVSRAVVVIFSFLSVMLLSSCSNPKTPVSKTGICFDTIVSITIYDDIPAERAEKMLSSCFEKMSGYEKLFSRTLDGSDVYKINHAGGLPVRVSGETAELLDQAIYYARLSEGTVDPTVGALSILWNIGSSEDDIIPDDNSIKEALSTTGWSDIEINDDTVTLKNDKTAIDLGFIAKGYIADRLKEYLVSEGISSAIIDLGGNILLIGDKYGNDFNIGLKDPNNPSGKPITTIKVSDKSIVSSGDYERFFEKDGIRYHHILSLNDGYPANSDLSMVTIISDKSTDGDALSTLCFILGKDASVDFLNRYYPDVNAVFVDKAGDISYLK